MNNTAQNFQQDYDKPDDILTHCTQLVSFDDAYSSHALIKRFGSPEQPIYVDESIDARPLIVPVYNGQLEIIQCAVMQDGEIVDLTIDGENRGRGPAKGFAKYGDFHPDKPVIITYSLESFFKVAQTGYAVALVVLSTLCSKHQVELKAFDFEQIQFVINQLSAAGYKRLYLPVQLKQMHLEPFKKLEQNTVVRLLSNYLRDGISQFHCDFGEVDDTADIQAFIDGAIEQLNPNTWGELIPLAQANTSKATAYPIHAFPPIARDAIKQAADYNHVPLALAGQTAMGLMVDIAQEHAQAPSDKTTKGQPCSFGVFSVFESGGGKDETRNLLARSIADREKKDKVKYLADRDAYNSLPVKERREEPKPINPITLYTKGTTQGIVKAMSHSVFSSFAWQTTEGAMILGGYSLTSDTMGESLGVINHLIDRGETSSILHGDDEPEIVIDKRFSVDLSIQDVMAKKALNNEALRHQGFLARFLFAAPEPLPIRKVTKEMRRIIASEDSAIIAFNELSERLKYPPHTEINPFSDGRTQFLKDDEADALHINFENYIKAAADKGGKYHIIRPNALRMIQYSLRVATVLTYFTPELHSIDAKTMQGAIDLCTYSLDEWIRYYGKDEEADSDQMLKWLLKQKSSKVLKSSISTHATPAKLRNKNIRDDVLTSLSDCNYVQIEKIGGKDYVVLNPNLS